LKCTVGAGIFELCFGNVGWLYAGGERPTDIFAWGGGGADGNVDTVDDRAADGADGEGTGSQVG